MASTEIARTAGVLDRITTAGLTVRHVKRETPEGSIVLIMIGAAQPHPRASPRSDGAPNGAPLKGAFDMNANAKKVRTHLLSLNRVADEIGISADTIVRHPTSFFPSLRLGTKRYVAREAYAAWVKTRLSEGIPEAEK